MKTRNFLVIMVLITLVSGSTTSAQTLSKEEALDRINRLWRQAASEANRAQSAFYDAENEREIAEDDVEFKAEALAASEMELAVAQEVLTRAGTTLSAAERKQRDAGPDANQAIADHNAAKTRLAAASQAHGQALTALAAARTARDADPADAFKQQIFEDAEALQSRLADERAAAINEEERLAAASLAAQNLLASAAQEVTSLRAAHASAVTAADAAQADVDRKKAAHERAVEALEAAEEAEFDAKEELDKAQDAEVRAVADLTALKLEVDSRTDPFNGSTSTTSLASVRKTTTSDVPANLSGFGQKLEAVEARQAKIEDDVAAVGQEVRQLRSEFDDAVAAWRATLAAAKAKSDGSRAIELAKLDQRVVRLASAIRSPEHQRKLLGALDKFTVAYRLR